MHNPAYPGPDETPTRHSATGWRALAGLSVPESDGIASITVVNL